MRKYDGQPAIWDSGSCVHEWGEATFTIQGNNSMVRGQSEIDSGNFAIPKFKGTNMRQRKEVAGNFCRLCGAWRGMLGLEPTPGLYISHLCGIFDLTKRVLKKTGTLWVVLDDSYAGSGKASGQSIDQVSAKQATNFASAHLTQKLDIPAKSLIGIPERFVLEMLNRGWIRRNTIIWHKNNPMPESVKDRFTSDFEYLYLFSQQQDYYFEQQFEQYTALPGEIRTFGKAGNTDRHDTGFEYNPESRSPLGRNKRCVWTINTKSYSGAHFAVFPPKLVETPILAGCPLYICSKCGKPRVKIYGIKSTTAERLAKGADNSGGGSPERLEHGQVNIHGKGMTHNLDPERKYLGYSDCGCGVPYVAGVVMDIFAGSGTTLQVALSLGRRSIGIDQSSKYCELATKRPAQLGMVQ